jgi:thiaminase
MLAGDLLEEIRADLASVEEAIRSARFVAALAEGTVREEGLWAIAGEQRLVVASDRRSFALLSSRFASSPAHEWFVSMQQGESEALALLDGYSDWLALGEDWFESYEPDPGAQAYLAFVAWLAVNGSVGAVAMAFLANLAAWGENCARVAAGLRDAYGAGDAAVAYFEFFAAAPPGFRDDTLAVAQAGLDSGDDPREIRRAARLLQAYELQFWDALAERA